MTNLALPDNQVHVYYAYLNQRASQLHQLAQTLSEDERVRAEQLHFEQDKNRFIARRGLLRTILGSYLGTQPGQLQFSYGRYGKPTLAKPFVSNSLHFNMSHSNGLALYAITVGRPLGVDLEYVRPIGEAEQIAERFFSAQENAVFRTLPASDKNQAFFYCWTRKEAYLKAIGDGLTRPSNQFSVLLDSWEPASPLSVTGDPKEVSGWTLQTLTPVPDYVAALAVEGHERRLMCQQWLE
jgi:4'-phosphopantetheinyl transferase